MIPMLAKIIVHAADREQAIARLLAALDATALNGIETNVGYLKQILRGDAFRGGQHTTSFLNGFRYFAHTIDVLSPGVQTTVQDYPRANGYWNIGVPLSGPMDGLAFRLANRLVANAGRQGRARDYPCGPGVAFQLRLRYCGMRRADGGAPGWRAADLLATVSGQGGSQYYNSESW